MSLYVLARVLYFVLAKISQTMGLLIWDFIQAKKIVKKNGTTFCCTVSFMMQKILNSRLDTVFSSPDLKFWKPLMKYIKITQLSLSNFSHVLSR